ncbi:MAG: alkaline phosphatase family protein [Candidatus Krumholzibacteria bacterium]|nr:alkaline phosphatase family protein [Candidatus Krumholzibacteria bacterium]
MSLARRVGRTTVVLVVITIIVVLTRREPVDRGGAPVDSMTELSPKLVGFEDINDLFASNEWKHSPYSQVVFIGIDGASWEFIDPLIEQGQLPNLARIKREGAYARLRSIPCYVSPPSWATMLTGYLPYKTGVYTYGKWDRSRREFSSVNAADVEVPSIWDVASQGGRRVGVFNIPMTYPSRTVRGAMVSGMLTPIDMGEPPHGRPVSRQDRQKLEFKDHIKSFSPVLKTAIDDSLNFYLWSLYDTADDQVKDYDRVHLEVMNKVDALAGDGAARSYTFHVGRFSPWIQILSQRSGKVEKAWCRAAIIRTPDGRYDTRLSPSFFRIEAPYTYPDTLADLLQTEFGYFVPSAFVGRELVADLTGDAVTHASYFYRMDDWDLYLYAFTQSDNIHHLTGFSPAAAEVYKTIDGFLGKIISDMPDDATLIVASDHGFGQYSYGVDLNLYLEKLNLLRWQDQRDIDYDHSIVFHNLWHLYFNHELITRGELKKRGIEVPPEQDPVDFLEKYLQESVRTIESAEGTLSVSLELQRLPDGGTGQVPDMFVKAAYDDYVVDFLGFENPHTTVLRGLKGNERWWHIRDGIFLAWGNDVRTGFDAGSEDIQDIAPTILYLLGLPIAADMDGKIISDILEPGRLASTDIYSVADYSQIRRETAPQKVDRESLEKKLRALGYIR